MDKRVGIDSLQTQKNRLEILSNSDFSAFPEDSVLSIAQKVHAIRVFIQTINKRFNYNFNPHLSSISRNLLELKKRFSR